jgi:type II secretion system protein D
MDDPRVKTGLYDPRSDDTSNLLAQNPPTAQPAGQQPATMQAPRGTVTITAFPELGQVVVSGPPEDVEKVLKIIEYIQSLSGQAETEVKLFTLKHTDTTTVAGALGALFQRVNFLPSGNTNIRQPTTPAAPAQQQGTVTVLPLPRQSAVLIAAPKGRMADVEKAIALIDVPIAQAIQAKYYTLKKANATRVANTITQFYTARFPTETTNQVRVTAEESTNTIIVTASPADHEEIVRLIEFLEKNSAPVEVKVFGLKKADAQTMALILQQLLYGGGTGTAGQRGGQGFQQQGGQQPFGLFGQQFGQLGQQARATAGGVSIDLHMAVDQRTNSLILAGSRTDIQLAEVLIFRLDSTDIRDRMNEVHKLKNTSATDIANSINQFLRTQIQLQQAGGELSSFSQIEREVVVVPEAISNSLIISATPRFFEDILKLVEKLDEEPPQVLIQVLIAQVRLDNTEEFGVELGLQSPVLFDRSIFPLPTGMTAVDAASPTRINYGIPFVPDGVTINNSINPAATLNGNGFNFNNTNPLGNNPLGSPGIVGFQGLSNLGTGRTARSGGPGGFIFSASSNSINVLVRALKSQGKLDVLSRPQIVCLDNQLGFIQIGQNVPLVTGVTITTGIVSPTVERTDVGVILQVTPKISPDGHVVMRVEPQVSSLSTSTVNLGNNVFAPIIDITQASTTVSAMDGHTVVLGGLMRRTDDKLERKVPWLGDLPYLGSAFRFRAQDKSKTELLILLTPHVIRNPSDAERLLGDEMGKMSWNWSHVVDVHQPFGPNSMVPCDPTSGTEVYPVPLPMPGDTELPMPQRAPTIPMKPSTRALPPQPIGPTGPSVK